MKLTNNILHALRGRKRDTEEVRIKTLLKTALPEETAALKAAELKLDTFKKQLLVLSADKKRIDADAKAYSIKCEKLEKQIKDKLGHNFYYEMGRGIRRNYGYRNPEEQANSDLANIIDSELLDLQLECLGLKDEALKAAIGAFHAKPLAEEAVKNTVAKLNTKTASI
jgi:hypothetical protein